MRALFLGTEIEGRHRGKKTLFVEGLVPAHDILLSAREHKVVQVYFGAVWQGHKRTDITGPSQVSVIDVHRVLDVVTTGLVTVEVLVQYATMYMSLLRQSFKDFELIVTVFSDKGEVLTSLREFFSPNCDKVQVKFVGAGSTAVVPLSAIITNQADEADQDILLWREE